MRRVKAALATCAGVESLFWFWSITQRHSLSAQPTTYAEGASGRPLKEAERRRAMDELVKAEFGAASGGAETTPERGRNWLSQWFFGTPFDEIPRQHARDFFAWALYNKTSTAMLTRDERDAVDRDIATVERLAEQALAADNSRSQLDDNTAEADPARRRSGALRCMRPTIDPTCLFDSHRPLIVYALTEAMSGVVQRVTLGRLGFERHTAGGMAYWYKAAPSALDPEKGASDARGRAPIVLFHGIGLGWFLYRDFVRDLIAANERGAESEGRSGGGGGAPLLLIETPSISLTLPWSPCPKPVDAVRSVMAILASRGWDDRRVSLWGHSFGTIYCGWMLKYHPGRVRSCTLVDPVNVGVQRATLCRSFLYEPRHRSKMQKFKRWFLHSDPRLVATLMRSFFWWENVLWLSDDELDGGSTTRLTDAGVDAREEYPGTVALFVAERDRYVDGPIVHADALKAKARRAERRARGDGRGRELEVVYWEGRASGHGKWLDRPETRDEVIRRILAE